MAPARLDKGRDVPLAGQRNDVFPRRDRPDHRHRAGGQPQAAPASNEDIGPQSRGVKRHVLFARQRQQQEQPVAHPPPAPLPDAPQQEDRSEHFGVEIVQNGRCHLPVVQHQPGNGQAGQRRQPVLPRDAVQDAQSGRHRQRFAEHQGQRRVRQPIERTEQQQDRRKMVREKVPSELIREQKAAVERVADRRVVQRQVVGIGLERPVIHRLDSRQKDKGPQGQNPGHPAVAPRQPVIGGRHLRRQPHPPFAPHNQRSQHQPQHRRPVGMGQTNVPPRNGKRHAAPHNHPHNQRRTEQRGQPRQPLEASRPPARCPGTRLVLFGHASKFRVPHPATGQFLRDREADLSIPWAGA